MTSSPPSNCAARTPEYRRAKIVCTLGSSEPLARNDRPVDARGHGRGAAELFAWHARGARAHGCAGARGVRRASEKPIGILADLQGPKIRTGALEGGRPVHLRAGQRFTISTVDRAGE